MISLCCDVNFPPKKKTFSCLSTAYYRDALFPLRYILSHLSTASFIALVRKLSSSYNIDLRSVGKFTEVAIPCLMRRESQYILQLFTPIRRKKISVDVAFVAFTASNLIHQHIRAQTMLLNNKKYSDVSGQATWAQQLTQ